MISATMVVSTVPVTDLEQAKSFYGGTLGLEFLWENPVSARFRFPGPMMAPTGGRSSRGCS